MRYVALPNLTWVGLVAKPDDAYTWAAEASAGSASCVRLGDIRAVAKRGTWRMNLT